MIKLLKEEILQAMGSKRYKPAGVDAFVEFFSNYSKEEVLKVLQELQDEYLIMKSKNDNFLQFFHSTLA